MTTFIEFFLCLQWSRDRREASGPSSVVKVLKNTSFCGGETFSEVPNTNRLSLSTHNVLYLGLKGLFKVSCLLEEICTLYRVLVFLQKKKTWPVCFLLVYFECHNLMLSLLSTCPQASLIPVLWRSFPLFLKYCNERCSVKLSLNKRCLPFTWNDYLRTWSCVKVN